MEEIMDTIHFTNKGRLMNTLEKFYIIRETKLNNQINDKLIVKLNIIFDTTVQQDPTEGYIMFTARSKQIHFEMVSNVTRIHTNDFHRNTWRSITPGLGTLPASHAEQQAATSYPSTGQHLTSKINTAITCKF
jgi:hypothetical protein